MQTVDDYIIFLQSKGFQLREDAIGFIHFGKTYTNASDELTNTAIELTLKAQKTFDGSFYVSLLEMLISNEIKNRREALKFIRDRELLAV